MSHIRCILILLILLTAIPLMAQHSSRPTIPSVAELAKLPPDGGPNWNRLVFEKSPYLLQHAANPVDWYPWGAEAFARAKELDRPVFLSVGYSTCHWCHVMEHESFEDADVAKLMNETFICIKVDREERPDIDHVYMTVTQALTGSGGWPMTVVMTPGKRPFFAGTYFPKSGRYGRPGMTELVPHIGELWKTDRKKLIETSDFITHELAKMSGSFPGDALDEKTIKDAFSQNEDRFDPRNGGFGSRPKFPVPHNLSMLLRAARRSGDTRGVEMVRKTLHEMRLGGIFDHVGYGFHRYSTDEVWLVPHFEKMLYDQALMAIACVETWQVTGDPEFRQTAEEILTYVLRDMTAPEGGFYSAEDADSEGEEGKFYVWSIPEVIRLLGEDEGKLFAKVYNFEEDGNFHEESTGQSLGVNIPHLRRDLAGVAKQMAMDPAELSTRIEAARAKLFAIREARIHPLKDDKVLTDWNGLMIAAFAKAGAAFDEPKYITAAQRAADFALAKHRTPQGRLLKRSRNGEAGLPGHLEDYAFLAWGLIELYEASFETRYLREAIALSDVALEQFHDVEGGGFFHTAHDGEELLVRSKEIYDGALPSGNAVMALNLIRLARMTGRTDFEETAHEVFLAFAGAVRRTPANHAVLLQALDFALGPTQEVVLAGDKNEAGFKAMVRAVRSGFRPDVVVLHRGEADPEIAKLAPFVEGQAAVDGKPTAYVCHNFACERPVQSAAELVKLLKGQGTKGTPGTLGTNEVGE